MNDASTRRGVALATWALVASLLGACRSSAPIAPPPAAPAAAPAVTVEVGVQAFEQRHARAGALARREGRLLDARWHWDVIIALRPDDAEARRQRKDVEDAMHAMAAERHARARAAHQKGDVDTAQRLYLEVLQVLPTHAAAADELRAMERERTRRGHVQALHATRAAQARALKGGAANGTPADRSTIEGRIEAEHASLLATSLNATTSPGPAPATTADPDACRRAPRLEATDRAAAVRAWRECLKARPGDARALSRSKALDR